MSAGEESLELELDRALAQWVGWLPRWQPSASRRRQAACQICPTWARALEITDVPHGALHALSISLEGIVHDHFTVVALTRFPTLQPGGRWQVGVEEGSVLLRHDPEGIRLEDGVTVMSAQQAAAAHGELVALHQFVLHRAMAWGAERRRTIVEVIDNVVEPKVTAMTEEMLAEARALLA